jgi:hypothetical protein
LGTARQSKPGSSLANCLLRRRIDYIVISAPAAMTGQWKAELESKFGLTWAHRLMASTISN